MTLPVPEATPLAPRPQIEEVEWCAPERLVAGLPARPGTVFLDSAMGHPELGRWSYVAFDPFQHFAVCDGRAYRNGHAIPGDPIAALRAELQRFALTREGWHPDILPGAAGAFSYEAAGLFERLPAPRPAPATYPEIELWFHDAAVVFDALARRTFIVSTGWPEEDWVRRMERRRRRADRLRDWLDLARDRPQRPPVRIPRQAWRSNTGREAHRAAVRRTREYIAAGDIFQANITHAFSAPLPGNWDVIGMYQQLRQANPATFGALIIGAEHAVASMSPERFLRLRGDHVETRPIKGTRPRSADLVRDRQLAEELLASEKDRAENVMIVDLLRNDLSRVSRPGTVEVPSLCALESYASVHHLVSVVTSRLRQGADALDLMAASFPGGSITGAPKIRAMEIIHELEPERRGLYCGSIVHFGFDGCLDSNIVIRTVTCRNSVASFGVGGGITLLSDPDQEYQESLDKAQRIFQAFEGAGR